MYSFVHGVNVFKSFYQAATRRNKLVTQYFSSFAKRLEAFFLKLKAVVNAHRFHKTPPSDAPRDLLPRSLDWVAGQISLARDTDRVYVRADAACDLVHLLNGDERKIARINPHHQNVNRCLK